MKERKTISIVLVSIFSLFFSIEVGAQVPDEVKALAGVYHGTWKMYGLNEKGEIVAKMAWTDIMEAGSPATKDGRAFVTTIDAMTFEGGIPPQKVEGKEGYFLNPDGSLGDYFFESMGQTVRLKKLNDQASVYFLPANPMEAAMLGLANGALAKHVVVKVIVAEDGVETHLISRVTTATWKDGEGKEHSRQFISLQGVHKRQK